MRSPDIEIIKGATFTTARVAGQLVAVKWSDSESAHYVSAGTGPASKYDNEREAMGRFMSVAMDAAGGVATVAIDDQSASNTRPKSSGDHNCTPECPTSCPQDDDDPRGWQG